jgi:hypothetical protein
MIVKEIQKRSRIQPGMLVMDADIEGEKQPPLVSLVMSLSPACKFDEDYPDAEEHIFYLCQPLGDAPSFVNYVCNLVQVS